MDRENRRKPGRGAGARSAVANGDADSARAALALALSWPVARRSFVITLVVGSILNLVNQGDALIVGGPVDWLKVALTYCVPFCVATYGAYCAGRMGRRA